LSTNEALSEAGPLPNNWGPIFGLSGFIEKLGDLSWIGPDYSDQGWIELTNTEQEAVNKSKVLARVEEEKIIANAALSVSSITVSDKIKWDDYLFALEKICLAPSFDVDLVFPKRPSV